MAVKLTDRVVTGRAFAPPATASRSLSPTLGDHGMPSHKTLKSVVASLAQSFTSLMAGGLAELRRVTRGPVALLTCDPALLRTYWLGEYSPEVIETEISRYPSVSALATGLGGVTKVTSVPIPLDCTDGFNDAYCGRPEMLLDPAVRLACSAWSFVEPTAVARFESQLARDLADGTWDARHGHLRKQKYLDGSLVLVVSIPEIEAVTSSLP